VPQTLLMIGLLLLPSLLVASPDNDATSQSVLELSIDQSATTSNFSILDFGAVNAGTPTRAEMIVKNVSDQSLVLDTFSFGNNLSSEWLESERTDGLRTRTTIGANESRHLEIDVLFDGSPSSQLSFMTQGKELLTLGVSYQIKSPTYCRQTLGGALSSMGDGQGGWYTFCLGRALPGYELSPTPAPLFAVHEDIHYRGHTRACDADFTHCKLVQADDNDVCYSVSVQGHHSGGGIGGSSENSRIGVNTLLRAYYHLKTPPTPRLISREAIEKNASTPPDSVYPPSDTCAPPPWPEFKFK
jgi:hypothetical protein